MAITSIVVVADDTTIEGGGVNLAFTPGGEYPAETAHRLYVRDQPFPRTGPPTRVVPSIIAVQLSYGQFGQGQQPPPLEPADHWVREVTFSADYVHGSWHVAGSEASLDLTIRAGLRDNTPPGEHSEPDDPFVAYLLVRALCLWTTEVSILDELQHVARDIGGIFRRP